MHPIFERQFAELQEAGLAPQVHHAPSGAAVITIPNFDLPEGWNRETTSIRFVAPAGYPFAAPDCFWTDPGLTLENGQPPKASNIQPLPEDGQAGTWFSWHVTQWNPNSDSLLTFFRIIRQRLQTAE